MRRRHTYPPKLKIKGNKHDVDALDALELPWLGIELHFGWGVELPAVDPSVETARKRDSFGWLLRALQQQG